MLNLIHGVWYLYSLRRLVNVEILSVMSCVERLRCRFSSVLNLKFSEQLFKWKIEESINLNQLTKNNVRRH